MPRIEKDLSVTFEWKDGAFVGVRVSGSGEISDGLGSALFNFSERFSASEMPSDAVIATIHNNALKLLKRKSQLP